MSVQCAVVDLWQLFHTSPLVSSLRDTVYTLRFSSFCFVWKEKDFCTVCSAPVPPCRHCHRHRWGYYEIINGKYSWNYNDKNVFVSEQSHFEWKTVMLNLDMPSRDDTFAIGRRNCIASLHSEYYSMQSLIIYFCVKSLEIRSELPNGKETSLGCLSSSELIRFWMHFWICYLYIYSVLIFASFWTKIGGGEALIDRKCFGSKSLSFQYK